MSGYQARPPSLGDTVYRLYPMLFGAGDNGYMEISTLSRNNSLTFNAAASTAVVTGKIRGFELGSETGNLTSIAEDDSVSLLVQPATANGAISMTFEEPGSTTYIDGYVSEDSSVIILRLYEEGTNDRLVGIIVGVKQ